MAYKGYGEGFGNIFEMGPEGGHPYRELVDPNFGILGPSNFGNTKIKAKVCPTGQHLVNGVCKPITTILTGKKCKDGSSPPCPEDEIPEDGGCGIGYIGRPPSASCPTCRCIKAATATEEEIKETFDNRFDGPVTMADIGKVRTDPITGQTITDTGLNTGDYRLDYSPYGAEERGQGRGTVYGDPLMSVEDTRLLRSFVNPYADIGEKFLDPYSMSQRREDKFLTQSGILGDGSAEELAIQIQKDLEIETMVDSFGLLDVKETYKKAQDELDNMEDEGLLVGADVITAQQNLQQEEDAVVAEVKKTGDSGEKKTTKKPKKTRQPPHKTKTTKTKTTKTKTTPSRESGFSISRQASLSAARAATKAATGSTYKGPGKRGFTPPTKTTKTGRPPRKGPHG